MTWIKQKDPAELQQPRPAAPSMGGEWNARPTARDSVPYEQVSIGSSMEIKGELTGNEDLTINGRVVGKIFLRGHTLTVAPNGKIRAEINDAASVVVQGEMIGNITARDRVEIASTGSMSGDIRAPRVALAAGASFKGSIDMDAEAAHPEPMEQQHERELVERLG